MSVVRFKGANFYIFCLMTLFHCFRALLLAIIGMLVVVCAACLAGIVMYANYKDCDPVDAGFVQFSDQVCSCGKYNVFLSA